jgi:hypothetical protein
MFTILQNANPSLNYKRHRLILTVVLMLPFVILTSNAFAKKTFEVEEATISDIHRAITTKQITCAGLVQAYIKRAAAYNGVRTKLVTADGAPIPPATGTVRAGAPLKFPTDTVAA